MDNHNGGGFVSLVGAGPGDPGLITLRGVERLVQADVVVYDRLANPLLLRMAQQSEWIPVGKQPGHHPIPQGEINAILVEKARLGKRVVRLKGGDPFVFGRGGEEALALREAGVQFEIVPGVTSATAVPAYAGIPVTHRDLAGSVAFITGHRTKLADDPEMDWLRNSHSADTLVFLMGVKNLPRIVEQLLAAGRDADTPVALIERGTFPNQKTITGILSNIVEVGAEIRPPAVFIVGDVVGLREIMGWYETLEHRPLFGLRLLNTKSVSHQIEENPKLGFHHLDEFGEQVYAQGGEAIHMPVLQIASPSDPAPLQIACQHLAEGGSYAWVIFTSANGVRAIFNQLTILGYDSRCLKGVHIAAIGPATARALLDRGIRPDFIPTRFIGAELGVQIPIQPGQKILLPRSEIALPELPKILKARGCVVDEVVAYSVATATPDTVVLEQLVKDQIDVVAFFSPSGVKGLADMLVKTGHTSSLRDLLSPLMVACIGPSTAKAAQEMGLRVEVVAQEYTCTGLVQELVRWRKHL
jgi:uroporphyrinogen III methyltransferase/synthase